MQMYIQMYIHVHIQAGQVKGCSKPEAAASNWLEPGSSWDWSNMCFW